MVQLASDDTLLEIDEIVPTDEATIEDWSRQFSGLFHTLGRHHPFAVNRPASLADGAWCAAIDLFRVSMVVRYGPSERSKERRVGKVFLRMCRSWVLRVHF